MQRASAAAERQTVGCCWRVSIPKATKTDHIYIKRYAAIMWYTTSASGCWKLCSLRVRPAISAHQCPRTARRAHL